MPQITKCVVGMFGAGGVWVAQVVVRLALTVAQSSCRAFGTGGARGSLKGGGHMLSAGGVLVAQVVARLALTVAQSSCRAFGTGELGAFLSFCALVDDGVA